MIVSMDDILRPARAAGYAAAAFTFWSLDSAQIAIEAAEELSMPVILQAGFLEIDYAGLDNIAHIGRKVAQEASVNVALNLDHGDTVELAKAAVEAGFTSVMIDASHLDYEENIETTLKVVDIARPHGVTVEAELGRLAGIEARQSVDESEAAQTDPDEAAQFVARTGIDALAVAVGTAHGFYRYEPKLNLDRLEKIAKLVSIPIVLHGGSGTPDDQVLIAIKSGIAKVNICTEFIAAFAQGYTQAQASPGFGYNVPKFFGAGKLAAKGLASRKVALFAGKG